MYLNVVVVLRQLYSLSLGAHAQRGLQCVCVSVTQHLTNHIVKVNLQEYVQPLYMQRYKVVYKFCRWISIVSQSLVTLVGIDVVEAVTAFSLCDSKLHCAIYYS